VVVSQVSALAGDLALAEFVDRHPALLVALNPRNRNLALATNQLDGLTYYTVGFLRLVASDPVYYLLGFWYGERALAWVQRRSRTYGPFVEDGERFFRRASYPLIFAAPNNLICALSAATGVRLGTFIALNISGTVARLVVIRQLGYVFQSPLQAIVDFIARYRVPVLIVSAILVAWTIFGEFRGDNSQIRSLAKLTGEADAEAEDGGNAEDGADRAPTEGPGGPVDEARDRDAS
jgi:membrane protein DedA with SNARE-associated domain